MDDDAVGVCLLCTHLVREGSAGAGRIKQWMVPSKRKGGAIREYPALGRSFQRQTFFEDGHDSRRRIRRIWWRRKLEYLTSTRSNVEQHTLN